MQTRYFEDFQAGDTLELGSRQISAQEIVTFAREYDPQPFHLDDVAARDTIFEGLAASGWHTAAIFMRLFVDGLLNHTISMGSPGIDEIRWPRPVRPDDTLHARFTAVECIPSRSRPNMGIIRGKGEMTNQHGETVMTLATVGFFGRRPDKEVT